MVGKGAALATALLSWALVLSPALGQASSPASGQSGLPNGNPGATTGALASVASVPTAVSPSPRTVPPGPVAVPAADPNEPARVYVYVGRTFWPGHSRLGIGKDRWDVSIDGGQRIPLTSSRFLEFDTPAGPHRFTRYYRGLLGAHPASIDLTLAPGEEAYLGLNWYLDINPNTLKAGEDVAFAGGFLFGVVGGLATGLAVAAVVGPGAPSSDQHKLGVWLVREPPPADEPTSSTAH